MCPDYQILSVYFDGELPSPWKEKMEAHLGSCAQCRAQLEAYKRCSQALQYPLLEKGGFSENVAVLSNGPELSLMELAKNRVWKNLGNVDTGKWKQRQEARMWRRTVSVPLPAIAAAAGLVFITVALLLTRQQAVVPQNQDTMAATGTIDMQGIVPVSDMNGVLQYLGNQDTTDIMIIRLPESRSFSSSGEPTIIKAADYSRRRGSQ